MKPVYSHIFDLLDFTDVLIARMAPDNFDINMHFMTLVYVEDILDKYGRSFVLDTAREAGESEVVAHDLMRQVSSRMDGLRATIRELADKYNFDIALDEKAKQLQREWHARSE